MQSQYGLKDYYVIVKAEDENIAREIMTLHWGSKWFTSYTEDNFSFGYFNNGCLLTISQKL